MLLRAAIVIFAVLNLGAATWWAVGAPPRAPAALPLDGPQLLLVSEVQRRDAALPSATPVPAVCLRFGPFAGPAARSGASTALAALGVDATPFEDRSGAASGWDVFLPAQATREEAVALAARLKESGVADVFVMNDGRNANRIALGRFSSEAGARRRAQELRGNGVEPAIEARGNGAPRIWLDARLPDKIERARVVEIAPAQDLDCKFLQ